MVDAVIRALSKTSVPNVCLLYGRSLPFSTGIFAIEIYCPFLGTIHFLPFLPDEGYMSRQMDLICKKAGRDQGKMPIFAPRSYIFLRSAGRFLFTLFLEID